MRSKPSNHSCVGQSELVHYVYGPVFGWGNHFPVAWLNYRYKECPNLPPWHAQHTVVYSVQSETFLSEALQWYTFPSEFQVESPNEVLLLAMRCLEDAVRRALKSIGRVFFMGWFLHNSSFLHSGQHWKHTLWEPLFYTFKTNPQAKNLPITNHGKNFRHLW